jgi:hypothetical protein
MGIHSSEQTIEMMGGVDGSYEIEYLLDIACTAALPVVVNGHARKNTRNQKRILHRLQKLEVERHANAVLVADAHATDTPQHPLLSSAAVCIQVVLTNLFKCAVSTNISYFNNKACTKGEQIGLPQGRQIQGGRRRML